LRKRREIKLGGRTRGRSPLKGGVETSSGLVSLRFNESAKGRKKKGERRPGKKEIDIYL